MALLSQINMTAKWQQLSVLLIRRQLKCGKNLFLAATVFMKEFEIAFKLKLSPTNMIKKLLMTAIKVMTLQHAPVHSSRTV